MNWKKFTVQLILWLIFSAVIPIIAIANKYDFVKEGTAKYTGWAIIAGVIAFIVVMVALRYILRLLKWSMTKQVISGIMLVIVPLCFLFVLTDLIANNIENIKFILVLSIISEFIAIPINPFPKMIWEKNIQDLKEAFK